MIIIGFRKAAEALHHEAGEALRDRMLAEFHKITSPVITREEYGKPAVREKIPFSVSHSGDIVICARRGGVRRSSEASLGRRNSRGFFLADARPCAEIGADIEKISDKRYPERTEAIAGRYFSCEEQALIRSSDDPVGCFYALWTRKESYIKLTGRGFPPCAQPIRSAFPKAPLISPSPFSPTAKNTLCRYPSPNKRSE